MRVKIEHEQVKDGLIFKTVFSVVRTTVTFTETERHIIKESNLADEFILERVPCAIKINRGGVYAADEKGDYWLRVKHLLHSADVWATSSIHFAKAYEAQLTDALHGLKQVIDNSADPSDTTIFEL